MNTLTTNPVPIGKAEKKMAHAFFKKTLTRIIDKKKLCSYLLVGSLLPAMAAQAAVDPLVVKGKTSNSVTHSWYSVSYDNFGSTPVLFAQMQTYDGPNTSGERIRNVSSTGFQVMIEEEASGDTEIGHTTEVVGFSGFKSGNIVNHHGDVVGQAGTVTKNQRNGSTWHTLSFGRTYSNPVVFMQMTTFRGADPTHVRVRNVTGSSAQYQLEEWDHKDGGHTRETISYLVLEEGASNLNGHYTLQDGTYLAVGSTNVNQNWTTVRDVPGDMVVLSQTQTTNEASSVVTRMKVRDGEFDVRLQEQEKTGSSSKSPNHPHAAEKVAWVAIASGPKPLAAVEALEAEDIAPADISGSHAAVNMTSFRGGRGIDYRGEGHIQWRVNVPETGRYLLKFGYALASGERALDLSIDGGSAVRLPFKSTGSWSTEGLEGHRVHLTAGNHVVRLATTGRSGPNMDYLDVVHETEGQTGHTPVTYYGGGGTPPSGQERFEGNSIFSPKMLMGGDKIVSASDPNLYAEMQGDGNFVVMDNGAEVFNTKTSKFWMETSGIQESVHHAVCQEQASGGEKAVCTRGVAVQLDKQGLRVVDANGMIVWRPDLGNLDLVDTSEGFHLRVARLSSGAGVLQLIRSSNGGLNGPGTCCKGKILWDSENGYRPLYKEVTGLFTAIEKDQVAQSPQAPWDMPDHDAIAVSDDHSDGQRHTYVHEAIKQQAVLHGSDRTWYSDGSWNARSADMLYDDPDFPRLGLQIRDNTRRNSIQLYDSPNSYDDLLWESPYTILPEDTRASLHVTHRGIEIRGYSVNNPGNKQILWSKYPDGAHVDHNYMLTLNKDLLRVELHNMTTSRLRWYASKDTGPEGVIVSNTSPLYKHNIAHVLRQRMGHVWTHLEHFVQGIAEDAAHTIADTNEWQDFKAIFNDATHLKVHAAFADIAKLEQDVVSDIGTELADVAKLMELMEHLASSAFLSTISNAGGIAKDLWDMLSHPKRIADYVHHMADSIKDANNKRKLFIQLLGDPAALETAVETYMGNELDTYSENFEDKIDTGLQLHRRTEALALSSDAIGDGWNTSNCSRVCRLLTKSKKTFFEIDAEGLMNLLTPTTAYSASHSLNHLQLRVGVRPLPRLVDVDGDGDLDKSRLQVAIKILDIASLLKLGGQSFVSAGVFTSHDWLIHLRNTRPDGSHIPLSDSALTLYSSTAGALAWADINLQDVVDKVKSAFNCCNGGSVDNVESGVSHAQSLANDLGSNVSLESQAGLEMQSVMSGDGMPGFMVRASQEAGEEAIEVIRAGSDAASVSIGSENFSVGSSVASEIMSDASVDGVSVESAVVGGAAAAEGGSAGLVRLVGDMYRMSNQVQQLAPSAGLGKISLVELLGGVHLTYAYNYRQLPTDQIVLIHLAEAGGALLIPVILNVLTDGAPTAALTATYGNPITAMNVETMIGSLVADTLVFFGINEHSDDPDIWKKMSMGVGGFGYLAMTGALSTDKAKFELTPQARGDGPAWTSIGFRKFPRIRVHSQGGVGTTLFGNNRLNFEY